MLKNDNEPDKAIWSVKRATINFQLCIFLLSIQIVSHVCVCYFFFILSNVQQFYGIFHCTLWSFAALVLTFDPPFDLPFEGEITTTTVFRSVPIVMDCVHKMLIAKQSAPRNMAFAQFTTDNCIFSVWLLQANADC